MQVRVAFDLVRDWDGNTIGVKIAAWLCQPELSDPIQVKFGYCVVPITEDGYPVPIAPNYTGSLVAPKRWVARLSGVTGDPVRSAAETALWRRDEIIKMWVEAWPDQPIPNIWPSSLE